MRIAVYYAPDPGDDWWRFGSRWLGRDARHGPDAAASPPAWPALGWSDDARERFAIEPRRYGFHATLVAPFRPAAGLGLEDVSRTARDFAARHAAVRGIALAPSDEGGFVALRPAGPASAVDALAFEAVRAFDALRAPLDPAERARRAKGLDARQLALLDRWGHGRVADQFRFHLSLSDALDAAARAQVMAAAGRVLAHERLQRVDLDGIALFVEGENRVFRMVERHALTGPVGTA